jgi:hypothetical protein
MDFTMSSYLRLSARRRVRDEGVSRTFADEEAAMLAEMTKEIPALHDTVPVLAFIAKAIFSRKTGLPSDGFARGLGNGKGLPSSTYHSAMSRSASRIIRRAERSVRPWLTTPGKSMTSAMCQPSPVS